MATVTAENETVEYDDYIDQQIDRTSFHVKTVDLVSGLIIFGLVVLGSLLAIVVVDHWIIGLNFWGRLGCLLGLIAAGTIVLATKVFPSLIRSINPEYAAHTVEQSYPSLKNGLLNFLFFRDRPDQVRENVLEGMRTQAATELAEVPIDSAVDRTPIIRLGYALVAVTAVWVGYILFSPKNPLQTLARVVTPWSDIQRPSQVDILEVTPGSVDVFQGQTVNVQAKIEGLKPDVMPSIEFSTLDGQLLSQRITMHDDGAAGHFAGELTLGESGIQQDLEYRVIAGDAVGRIYEVHAIEAPHIVVDRIEYQFPAYTKKTSEIVQGDGDIRAIEGTKITVHGKANQTIRRGYMELLPAIDENDPTKPQKSKQARLTPEGKEARTSFTLRMDANRKYSVYRGYRLHFTNENDLDSVDPVEHSIEVVPDLRPIVQILTPESRQTELPVNGFQKVEVRAVDPDYQLTRVQLGFRSRTRPLVQKDLFVAKRLSEAHSGQFVATYNFVPAEHGLKEGDIVEYLAVAKDTRHAPLTNKLDPNVAKTAKQYLRIVAADPLADEPPQDAPEDPQRRLPEDPQNPADQPNDEGNPNQAPQDGEQQNQQGGDQDQQGGQQQQGGENDEQSGEKQKGGQQGDSGLQGKGQESENAQDSELDSGQQGSNQSEQNNSGQGTGGNQKSESQQEGSQQNGSQNNDPSDSSDGGQSGDQNDPNSQPNDGSQGGNQQQQGDRGARDDEPLPSSGERDGEVVERIRDHMQENGEWDDSQDAGSDENNQENTTSEGDSQNGDAPESPQQDQGSDPQTDPSQQGNDSGQQQQPSEPTNQPDGSKSDSGGNEPGENQGSKPRDGAQQDGASEQAQDGQPSDKPGSPGSEGDRHTDAANSSDDPGDSPSDGKENQNQDGSPSKQESGDQSSPQDKPQQGESGEQSGERPESGSQGEQSRDGQSGVSEENDQSDGGEAGEKSADGQSGNSQEQGKQSDGSPGDGQESQRDQNGNGQESKSSDKQGDSNSESQDQPSGSGERTDADGAKGSKGKSDQSGSKSNTTDQSSNPSGSQSQQGESAHNGDGQADSQLTGDDANLEYAREATDLVLEYLKDQEKKPDQELLDKLGWKPEDVQKFVRRWDQMKKNAQGEGTKQPGDGKRQLDEILRGMGLKAPNNVRKSVDRNDAQRNNRETGRRTTVPKDWRDPFRAFQRALQKSK